MQKFDGHSVTSGIADAMIFSRLPARRSFPLVSLGGRGLLYLFRRLHNGLLHAVLAGPIEADLVTIWIVQVRVAPAPRHHAWHLRYVKVLSLQLAAKLIEFPNLKVQTYALAGERGSGSSHVQSDRAVTARGAQPRVDRFTLVAELVHHLESQKVTIKL